MANDNIKDKVILLPGATGGIGAATARQLAAAGAKLVLLGRDSTKVNALRDQIGGDAIALTADITDEAAVSNAVTQAKGHFGHIDVLINMPGLSRPAKLWEMDVDDFDLTFNVNVKGMFLCSKHFVKQVDPQRGGLIVSISSEAGKQANPNAPAYCAAKAAMNMLSAGLAMQTKEANVRVSIVSPGAVTTPGFWRDRKVPHEKFLKPEDVANVITFVVGLPAHVVLHDVYFEPWEMFRTK